MHAHLRGNLVFNHSKDIEGPHLHMMNLAVPLTFDHFEPRINIDIVSRTVVKVRELGGLSPPAPI